MTAYECRSCDLVIDPDLEPSPGEPRWCADCDFMRAREAS